MVFYSWSALVAVVTCFTVGAAQETDFGWLRNESRSLQDLQREAIHSPDCPTGWYDTTDGRALWWQCGFGCQGGTFTDANCTCACQPIPGWGESTTTTTSSIAVNRDSTLPVIPWTTTPSRTTTRAPVVINTDPQLATTSQAASSGGDDSGDDVVELAIVLGVTIPLGIICVPCCTLCFLYIFYLIAHRNEWFNDESKSKKLAVVKEIGSGIDLLRRRFSAGSLDSNNLGYVHTKRGKRNSGGDVPGIAVQSTRDMDLEAARSATASAFLPQVMSPDGSRKLEAAGAASRSTSPAGSVPLSNGSMSARSAQGGNAPAISASWAPGDVLRSSARNSQRSSVNGMVSPRSPIVGAVVHSASVRSWSPAAHPHTPSVRSESPSVQAQQGSNRIIGPVGSSPIARSSPVGAYAGQQGSRRASHASNRSAQAPKVDDECSSQHTPQQRKIDELHALRHGVQSWTTASMIQPASRQLSPNSPAVSPRPGAPGPPQSGSPATSTGVSPRGFAAMSVCHTVRITPSG